MPISELDQPPTTELIRAAYIHASSGGEWHRQREIDRRLYDAYYDLTRIPTLDTANKKRKRKYTPRRLGTAEAARIVELIRGRYEPVPRIGVMDYGGRVSTDAQRERVEMACQEAIDQLNPAADSPYEADNLQIVLFGRTVRLGPIHGGDYFWDFPERPEGSTESEWFDILQQWRLNGPLPFLWQSLPAECAFPTSWGNLDVEGIAWVDMTWHELVGIFGEEPIGSVLPEKREQRYDTVPMIIFSNRRYLAYALILDEGGGSFGPISWGGKPADRLLRVVEHGLGRSALRFIAGNTTGRKEAGRFWLSALFHVLPLIDAADRMHTLAGISAEFNALPMIQHLRFLRGDQTGARAESEEIMPGDALTAWVDPATGRAEEWRPVYQPQHGDQNLELLLMELERIERISGTSRVLEGIFGPAGTPAWSQNVVLDTAKEKLAPITGGVVAGTMDAAEMIMLATEKWGQEIVLFSKDAGKISLRPEDVKGLRPMLKGSYGPRLPINWRADWELALQSIVQSLDPERPLPIPWTYIVERFMGIEQPMELYKEWARDKALLDPSIIQALVRNKLREIEADLATDEGMTIEEFMGIPPEELPPGARDIALQQAGIMPQQLPPAPMGAPAGNGAAPLGPTASAQYAAGSPFTQLPGGPQPQEGIAPYVV